MGRHGIPPHLPRTSMSAGIWCLSDGQTQNTWKHLETPGNTWKHLETPGNTLETPGNTWKHPNLTQTPKHPQAVFVCRRRPPLAGDAFTQTRAYDVASGPGEEEEEGKERGQRREREGEREDERRQLIALKQAPWCRRCPQVRGQFECWCWSILNKQSPVQQQFLNVHWELPVEIRTDSKR